MDQGNSDLDAPNPTPPGANLELDAPNPIPPGPNFEQGGPSQNPGNKTRYEPLFKAVRSGNLDATEKFLEDNPEAVNAGITSDEETALHIATLYGHLHIIERLVQLMSEDDLALLDKTGMTALQIATIIEKENNMKAVKCMVKKNKRLVTIPEGYYGWIPVTVALDFGLREMARYLYSVTPFEVFRPENGTHGGRLLTLCYYHKMLDIALDLIKQCPRLAMVEGTRGLTFLETLATVPYPFRSEIQPPFWKRLLQTWVHAYQEPASAINEVAIDEVAVNEVAIDIPPETTERRYDHVRGTSRGLWHQWVKNILHLLGIEKIYEKRLAHKQCLELLHAACNVIPTLSEEEICNVIPTLSGEEICNVIPTSSEEEICNVIPTSSGEEICNVIPTSSEEEIRVSRLHSALHLAAQRGNPEFIVEAVKVHFPLVWTKTVDGRRLFFLAVQFRQEKVFNLIHGFILKCVFANIRDENGNCLLHMAGLRAPLTRLNHIPGALLQMQRELQWFKEVESIMPTTKKEYLNHDNITPRELFTENHKELVKQGEKWTKGTASSCGVVAALVATITFAAAFTVPGGNDPTKGYPIFLLRKLFMVFEISNAVSLFSSSTSLLMFLGLLTSRYAEDDFLKSLPTKLIIGLSTMFISIAAMMVAFCAALFLMLRDQYSWIVIPLTVLACVPITLYIWLQFPLLVEIFMSTYGPGIFHRNVKPWP